MQGSSIAVRMCLRFERVSRIMDFPYALILIKLGDDLLVCRYSSYSPITFF